MKNIKHYIISEYGFKHDVKFIDGVAFMHTNHVGWEEIDPRFLGEIKEY